MKIVYFHQGYFPSHSPSSTFISFNARGFYLNGIDFTLLTGKNSDKSITTILSQTFKINEPIDIRLIDAPLIGNSHILLQIKTIYKLLFSMKFDVFITRSLRFLPFAYLIKRVKKCITVFEAHDFYTDLSIRDEPNIEKKKARERLERTYLPKLDGIICVSGAQKQVYDRYYPEQHIIKATTGAKQISIISPKTEFTYRCAYFGSFSLKKYKLDILIKAFNFVKTKNVELLIIGGKTKEEINKIERIIRKEQLESRITVLSWQSPAEIEMIKSTIDVGCAILGETFLNNIASPLKVLDYLSHGIPVIATSLQGISDIIIDKKHGFLVENTPEAWANALDTIYEDIGRYIYLSRNCLDRARELSWENRAKTILNELEKIKTKK